MNETGSRRVFTAFVPVRDKYIYRSVEKETFSRNRDICSNILIWFLVMKKLKLQVPIGERKEIKNIRRERSVVKKIRRGRKARINTTPESRFSKIFLGIEGASVYERNPITGLSSTERVCPGSRSLYREEWCSGIILAVT